MLKLNISEIDALDGKGETALDRAIRANHESIATFLFQEMRPSPAFLTQVNALNQTLIHRVATSSCAQLIPLIVGRLTQNTAATGATTTIGGGENAENSNAAATVTAAAKDVLAMLQAPDNLGLTPFEYTLMFGHAGTSLRLTSQMHQLGGKSQATVSIPIAADFLTTVPVLSPALRVLLYDMFRIREVSTTVGLEPSKPRHRRSHRMTFSDLRVLGIQHLQQDRFVASRCDDLFSIDHERICFKEIIPTLNLDVRVKFQFDSIKHLPTRQQVDILTRLNGSALLGRYSKIDVNKFPISSVVLSLAPTRAAVELKIEDHAITESFFLGKDVITTGDLDRELSNHFHTDVKQKRKEVDAALQTLSTKLRALPHPTLKNARLAVDYSSLPALDDSNNRATVLAALDTILTKGLHYGIVDGLFPLLEDALAGITEQQLSVVAPTSSLVYSHIVFRYQELPADERPAVVSTTEGSQSIIISFSKTRVADVLKTVQPLTQLVLRDSVVVQVHLLRDAFLAKEPDMKFKLEIEGTTLDKFPLGSLQFLLTNVTSALKTLRGLKNTVYGFSTAYHVGDVVSSTLRAIMVLYSTKRPSVAKLNGSKLMLCITPNDVPTVSAIVDAVRHDIVEAEIARVTANLSTLFSDLAQRLATYLPSATLVVDLPSMSACVDHEDTLAAIKLLAHDHSAHVIQPLIKGLSMGWDTKLGAVVRKHVKQVHVVLCTGHNSALTLHPGGVLVYDVSLLSGQSTPTMPTFKSAASQLQSNGLLSAQEIASTLFLQLLLVDKTILKMVDRTKAFACWCEIQGAHTKQVSAGSTRCTFSIIAKNILNRRCNDGGEDFVVRGTDSSRVHDRKDGRYVVHFNAPATAGALNLRVSLYSQPLKRSPLHIMVMPGPCHPPSTTVISTYDTIVENTPCALRLQLRDSYGNPIRQSPKEGFSVDGPSPTNPDGVAVTKFADAGAGIIQVEYTVSKPSKQCPVFLRVSFNGQSHVITHQVEVMSQDGYDQWKRIKNGIFAAATGPRATPQVQGVPPRRAIDYAALFFRKAIRKSYADKRRKEMASLGSTEKVFPPKADAPRKASIK